ncbi:MAG: hypothetical protein AB1Z67_01890 [Candidatus Limnocylindrales bacterium]
MLGSSLLQAGTVRPDLAEVSAAQSTDTVVEFELGEVSHGTGPERHQA